MPHRSPRTPAAAAAFLALAVLCHPPAASAQDGAAASTNDAADGKPLYGAADPPAEDWYGCAIAGRAVIGYATQGCSQCHFGQGAPGQSPREKLREQLAANGLPEAQIEQILEGTYGPEGDDDAAARAGIDATGGADGWILRSEINIYAEDKHRQAWTVLKNERSREMAKLLRVLDEDGASAIHRDVRCLACHAAAPADYYLTLAGDTPLGPSGWGEGEERIRSVVPDSAIEAIDPRIVSNGIGCEGCHGPSAVAGRVSSDLSAPADAACGEAPDRGWYDTHWNNGDLWRKSSAADKLAKFGYWDVHNRRSQARICMSCHVGDVKQGKVVTHEMYAAGHPPLPGFEMVTFMEQEPRHWRPLEQKKERVRDDYLARAHGTGLRFDAEALQETRRMLVGSSVALAQSLRLAADLADPAVSPPSVVPKPEWPELTAFACYACHHELAVPSWRQRRGQGAGPGRPTFHEWPESLFRVAAVTAGRDPAAVDAKLAEVTAVLTARPFGREEDVVARARAVAEWADAVAADLDVDGPTRADGWAVLERIAEAGVTRVPDYNAARQLVWAYSVVYDELEGDLTEPGTQPEWYPEADDPIEQTLASLRDNFRLDLVRTRQESDADLTATVKSQEVAVADALRRLAGYDPPASATPSPASPN